MALEQMNRMALLVERNWCAAWASLGAVQAQPATIVDDLPEVLRVYTPGLPETLLNMVIRYTDPQPVTERQVERIIAPYREHKLPFQWWLTRGMEPAGLRERLAGLGMETWGGATMMCLPLDGWSPRYPSVPDGVTLRRALRDDEMLTAVTIICNVFYIPQAPMLRWTTLNPAFDLWLGSIGARPVAAMATLVDGDTVGVYHVATLPGARRRGIAGNLLRLALDDARARGCHWATLTATPEARALYESLGFHSCGLLEQWMPSSRFARELSGVPARGLFDGYWD
ncbi:MAG TPA: GNAT family N-acetyltransferase [Ktedonobacterales bacterium]|jgi:GNAT superfamily N-acetyltransferase|nr:GNAT family N-acetyltransferase [Ktedonobacterales bacterium]